RMMFGYESIARRSGRRPFLASLLQDQAQFFRPHRWRGLELMRAHWVHHAFAKHFHDCYTIGINDRGAGCFECRHKNNNAWPDTLNLIAPGETHTGQARDGGGWIYRDFYVRRSMHARIRRASERRWGAAVSYPHRSRSGTGAAVPGRIRCDDSTPATLLE